MRRVLLRALVVEDDSQCRNLICRLLSREGVEVVPVADGRDALLVLERQVFDVIVTDLEMPRVDGRVLCATVRQLSRRIPILVVSSSAPSPRELALLQADGFVAKPFAGEEFMRAFYGVTGQHATSG